MRKLFQILVLVVLNFTFVGTTLFAQTMDVEQCINYTLSHNYALRNQELLTQICHENYQQAKRDILPDVDAGARNNLSFGKSIDPITNDYINERFTSTSFYVSAEMDLFKGFINRNTMQFNKFSYLMNQEDERKLRMDLAFKTMNAYYDVLYYQGMVEITKEQVSISELNLKKTSKQVDLGLKAKTELLEMEARIAEEQHNLVQMQNNFVQSLLNLKQVMNYPINDSLMPQAEDGGDGSNYELYSHDKVFEEAVKSFPSVVRAQMNTNAQKKQLDISKGSLLPTLSLGAGYSTYYSNSNEEPIEPGADQYRTISFNNQIDQNASENVYLRLSIPIFYRWSRMSNIQTNRMRFQMAKNEQLETEQLLYQQIVKDLQQLKAYAIETEQLNRKLNAEQASFEVSEKKLEKGMISIIEFYTSKNNVAKTKTELLRTETLKAVKSRTIDFYLGKEYTNAKPE